MSYKCVSPGVYIDSRTGNFVERPWIAGKRTWRKLKSRTLKDAKRELAARRIDQTRATHGLAKDPYAPPSKTVGDICAEYQSAGCPDRQHSPKHGKALEQEVYRLKTMLPFWSKRLVESVKAVDCALYFAWRKKRLKRKKVSGARTVDLELGTLNNALHWAASVGRIHANPLAAGRPKFRSGKTIRHCRDFMPVDGNELHHLARKLFAVRRSETLGWQLLVEAMTGCRTSEVLKLRWDADHMSEPGFIDGNTVWIVRAKGGVNPFVEVHPALAECLSALKKWHLWRFPKSEWWFPSARRGKDLPVTAAALTRALKNKKITKLQRTSHGLRAYYVTVRRSQGVSDAQIAAEIGDKSGAAIIVSTYGAVPPNWRGSEALSWLPTKGKPAWEVLKMPENVIALHSDDGSKFQTGPKPVTLSR
jgi:integrase